MFLYLTSVSGLRDNLFYLHFCKVTCTDIFFINNQVILEFN